MENQTDLLKWDNINLEKMSLLEQEILYCCFSDKGKFLGAEPSIVVGQGKSQSLWLWLSYILKYNVDHLFRNGKPQKSDFFLQEKEQQKHVISLAIRVARQIKKDVSAKKILELAKSLDLI